jgi:predicted lipoprotein with Yx(FWY)xxD motif
MMRSRSIRTFLATGGVVALVALALAGCGSSSKGASSPPAQPISSNGQPATLGVANNTSLGNILVDSTGRTLYFFGKDTGTTSTCTGACASNWPPLTASGTPTVGSGANASLLGTTPRSGGTSQVTYSGHPVYLFAGDHNPGDTNGQGITAFGGSWAAVTPAGALVSSPAPTSGGGGGY